MADTVFIGEYLGLAASRRFRLNLFGRSVDNELLRGGPTGVFSWDCIEPAILSTYHGD